MDVHWLQNSLRKWITKNSEIPVIPRPTPIQRTAFLLKIEHALLARVCADKCVALERGKEIYLRSFRLLQLAASFPYQLVPPQIHLRWQIFETLATDHRSIHEKVKVLQTDYHSSIGATGAWPKNEELSHKFRQIEKSFVQKSDLSSDVARSTKG